MFKSIPDPVWKAAGWPSKDSPELTSFFQVIVATKFVKVTHSLSVRSGGETDGPWSPPYRGTAIIHTIHRHISIRA